MNEIQIKSEAELMEKLFLSNKYKRLKERYLPHKIDREKAAWQLLQNNRGKYTPELLNRIFDTVDTYPDGKGWFGQMLATPNRNLIFQTPLKALIEWLEELLFSGRKPEDILNHCLKERKVKGASKGLATLLIYLSNPEQFNIWVNSTEEGLVVLRRIVALKGNWGSKYGQFNKAALDFRDTYNLKPQEMDWILAFIGHHVESDDEQFLLSKEALELDVEITVDDEPDELDDVVGEPMELGVMRWTPTNEMGVVALFVGFMKELGFPIIDIIRTRFPDAAVFKDSKKGQYLRRYVEFEFRSSGYKSHLKSKRKCHYVICWEHDWKECPIQVIELKTEIPKILDKKA